MIVVIVFGLINYVGNIYWFYVDYIVFLLLFIFWFIWSIIYIFLGFVDGGEYVNEGSFRVRK